MLETILTVAGAAVIIGVWGTFIACTQIRDELVKLSGKLKGDK